jgi:hypothetical protein
VKALVLQWDRGNNSVNKSRLGEVEFVTVTCLLAINLDPEVSRHVPLKGVGSSRGRRRVIVQVVRGSKVVGVLRVRLVGGSVVRCTGRGIIIIVIAKEPRGIKTARDACDRSSPP